MMGNNSTDIREAIRNHAPLLFDGAMGTYFAALPGRRPGRCELASLEEPDAVAAIHRAYLEAGCRAIRANTFDAGRDFAGGDPALGEALIRSGWSVARQAAETFRAFVFADLGPAPEGAGEAAERIYQRQAEIFLELGAGCFVMETLSSPRGVAEFAQWLKGREPEVFLLVSFAVDPQGFTREGLDGRALIREMMALPQVDAAGFNCMSGPAHLLELARSLGPLPKPLSVMPNAGYPTVVGRRAAYDGKPAYFGDKLAEIARVGASIVGGCCGTTPAHIQAAAAALQSLEGVSPRVPALPREAPRAPTPEDPFWEKLTGGERVVAVELDPPRNADAAPYLAGARALKAYGADALTIADCPVGRPRADSSLLACKVRREAGIPPIPHLTCRDRNLNATKALLLGLAMEGIRDILIVTGDPVPAAERDEVKSVFHFNSRKLIRYAAGLGGELPAPFHIFAALNLNARNFDVQLRLAREKEEAGAVGFLTQPVHSKEALANLQRAREVLSGRILGGVFPIVSHRNAVFLNNEVAGVRVCDELVSRYEGLDRAAAEDLAVESSLAIAEAMRPCTDGFYLMTPFRRVELMGRIMRGIRRG